MDTRKIATGSVLMGIAAALVLFYTVRTAFLVAGIGVGIGVLLIPIVRFLRSKARVPASVTAFLVIIGLFVILGGVGYSIYLIASDEMVKAIDALPKAYAELQRWLSHHSRLGANLGLSSEAGLNVSTAVKQVVGTVIQGATLGFKLIAGLFFVISIALYVAVDPARIQAGFLTLFPGHARSRIAALMHESAHTLRQWFLSHLIVVVCVGALFALGLWIIGNPYWILFGFLAAVLDFVPYIGPFAIALGAASVELAQGSWVGVLWVVILDVGIQEIEGHVLLPIVMKERIDLPPVQLLALAVFMGLWFGILGVFAAPPLLAVLRTVYLHEYAARMDARVSPPSAPVDRAA